MAKNAKPNSGVSAFSQTDAAPAGPGLQPQHLTLGHLTIDRALFEQTLAGLAARSANWRESAAIWAGTLGEDTAGVSRVYFHHDLCDDRGGPLSLAISEAAKFQLYEALRREGLKLVALIHTHPKDWVDLSLVDQSNQLCSRIGFWSLVVPWYGKKPWSLSTIGIHVKSDVGWYRLTEKQALDHFNITGE